MGLVFGVANVWGEGLVGRQSSFRLKGGQCGLEQFGNGFFHAVGWLDYSECLETTNVPAGIMGMTLSWKGGRFSMELEGRKQRGPGPRCYY
jgi:hypothetical protein